MLVVGERAGVPESDSSIRMAPKLPLSNRANRPGPRTSSRVQVTRVPDGETFHPGHTREKSWACGSTHASSTPGPNTCCRCALVTEEPGAA